MISLIHILNTHMRSITLWYLINYPRDIANKIRPDLLEVCDDFCGTRRKTLEFLARPDIAPW
jgi:hypothetical protein